MLTEKWRVSPLFRGRKILHPLSPSRITEKGSDHHNSSDSFPDFTRPKNSKNFEMVASTFSISPYFGFPIIPPDFHRSPAKPFLSQCRSSMASWDWASTVWPSEEFPPCGLAEKSRGPGTGLGIDVPTFFLDGLFTHHQSPAISVGDDYIPRNLMGSTKSWDSTISRHRGMGMRCLGTWDFSSDSEENPREKTTHGKFIVARCGTDSDS